MKRKIPDLDYFVEGIKRYKTIHPFIKVKKYFEDVLGPDSDELKMAKIELLDCWNEPLFLAIELIAERVPGRKEDMENYLLEKIIAAAALERERYITFKLWQFEGVYLSPFDVNKLFKLDRGVFVNVANSDDFLPIVSKDVADEFVCSDGEVREMRETLSEAWFVIIKDGKIFIPKDLYTSWFNVKNLSFKYFREDYSQLSRRFVEYEFSDKTIEKNNFVWLRRTFGDKKYADVQEYLMRKHGSLKAYFDHVIELSRKV